MARFRCIFRLVNGEKLMGSKDAVFGLSFRVLGEDYLCNFLLCIFLLTIFCTELKWQRVYMPSLPPDFQKRERKGKCMIYIDY